MNYEGNYHCWTVICKNKECGHTLLLQVIGPVEMRKFDALSHVIGFTITCQVCKKEESYGGSDVKMRELLNPPKDYLRHEFIDALRWVAHP
jgi:hypothetical protein